MSHTNAQVAAAFIRGDRAQSNSMRSTGAVLYSYGTPIAYRQDNGVIRVSCRQHSVTTSRHHSELWSAAHAAGYDGPPSWAGAPDKRSGETRAAYEERAATRASVVPFHQIERRTDKGHTWDSVAPPVEGRTDRHDPAVTWTFSPAAYEERAATREWYESRNHTTVTRKEPATA